MLLPPYTSCTVNDLTVGVQQSKRHKLSFSHDLNRHPDSNVCSDTVLPRSIRCIWWRTQRPARDSGSGWGHPTSVCHQSDDTDDKMTNDWAFLFHRGICALDRKISMYALINIISSISIGNLSNTWQQYLMQLIHYIVARPYIFHLSYTL